MSTRRRLDWSTAMRDYRAASPANPFSVPLVVNGKIDKGALMRRAVATARSLRAGGKSWIWRMSVGLRSAWSAARADMAAARPIAAPKASAPVLGPRRWIFDHAQAPTYDRGSYRATTHAW